MDAAGNVFSEAPSVGTTFTRTYSGQQLTSQTSGGVTHRFFHDAYAAITGTIGGVLAASTTANPLANNRYALAAGNPVNYVETDGHRVVIDEIGGFTPADLPRPPPNAPPAAQEKRVAALAQLHKDFGCFNPSAFATDSCVSIRQEAIASLGMIARLTPRPGPVITWRQLTAEGIPLIAGVTAGAIAAPFCGPCGLVVGAGVSGATRFGTSKYVERNSSRTALRDALVDAAVGGGAGITERVLIKEAGVTVTKAAVPRDGRRFVRVIRIKPHTNLWTQYRGR